jgi:hypothetical protein
MQGIAVCAIAIKDSIGNTRILQLAMHKKTAYLYKLYRCIYSDASGCPSTVY